jgi:hypothetical protein
MGWRSVKAQGQLYLHFFTVLNIEITYLAPFCTDNFILSWRRRRDNATFIIASEIYCSLMPVSDNFGPLSLSLCPWTRPCNTTHIVTQINIKFCSLKFVCCEDNRDGSWARGNEERVTGSSEAKQRPSSAHTQIANV